jgi:hypothetical protein
MSKRWVWGLGLVAVLAVAAVAAGPKITWITKHEGRAHWWTLKTVRPVFGGKEAVYGAANHAFAATLKATVDDYRDVVARLEKDNERPNAPYTFEATPLVSLATPTLVSGWFFIYQTNNGVHPNDYYRCLAVGLVDGKARRLKAADLLRPERKVADFGARVLLPFVNAEKVKRGAAKIDALPDGVVEDFVLTPTAIDWQISADEVGPYAEGAYEVKVPYDDIKQWTRIRLDADKKILGLGDEAPAKG